MYKEWNDGYRYGRKMMLQEYLAQRQITLYKKHNRLDHYFHLCVPFVTVRRSIYFKCQNKLHFL